MRRMLVMSVKVIKKSNFYKKLFCLHLPVKAIQLSSYKSLNNKIGFCKVLDVCIKCGKISTRDIIPRYKNKTYNWTNCYILTKSIKGDLCIFPSEDVIKKKVGL